MEQVMVAQNIGGGAAGGDMVILIKNINRVVP
jgi:hypothetical protein